MQIQICAHIKMDGQRCGSPALRGFTHCYYHKPLRQMMPARTAHLRVRPELPRREISFAELKAPLLEDAVAIQIGLTRVIDDLLHDRVSVRQARLILSELRSASAGLRQRKRAMSLRTRGGRSSSFPARAARWLESGNQAEMTEPIAEK